MLCEVTRKVFLFESKWRKREEEELEKSLVKFEGWENGTRTETSPHKGEATPRNLLNNITVYVQPPSWCVIAVIVSAVKMEAEDRWPTGLTCEHGSH